jgi:hypothetical protein
LQRHADTTIELERRFLFHHYTVTGLPHLLLVDRRHRDNASEDDPPVGRRGLHDATSGCLSYIMLCSHVEFLGLPNGRVSGRSALLLSGSSIKFLLRAAVRLLLPPPL